MSVRAFVGRVGCVLGLLMVVVLAPVGCRRAVDPLVVPQRSAVALTGGSNTSMIYLARTSNGVLAIDLGWWGDRSALTGALAALGATTADVRWVFLTHSHRDHIAAWPVVRHARFHIGAVEEPLLVGAASHGGLVPRWIDRLKPSQLPRRGELSVTTLDRDTTILIGADTMRAFMLPGHTAGSVVYLFRGVLFLGDAVTYSRAGGFAPAKPGYSDDPRVAAENLTRLWPRLPAGAVRYACTAHAHCTAFTQRFLDDVSR